MANEILHAFIEPHYVTSVCFTKTMEGLIAGLEKSRAELAVLNAVDELPVDPAPAAAVLIGDKEAWIRRMIPALRERGVKPILAGANPAHYGEGVSGCMLDRQTMIEHMIQYFCSAGRRRLACVGNDPRDVNDQVRVAAFLRHARSLGLPVTEADVYPAETCLGACIDRFLDRALEYDGALCVNDFVGVQLILAAARRGIAVPDQLFVAGSGNQILGICIEPKLTTSTLDFSQVGMQAVNIWSYLAKHPEISAQAVSVPCALVCRGSTAGAPLPKYRAAPMEGNDAADLSVPPSILRMRRLEGCLMRCDVMDLGILRGVLEGLSDDRIAERLFVSHGTVQYRLKKLYREAAVHTKRELHDLLVPYVNNLDFPDGFPSQPQF